MFKFQRYYTTVKTLSENTIYALCSGQGKCGVAVIRISGKDASLAIKKLTKYNVSLPPPRYANLTAICHPKTNDVIDKGLLFWFPSPNSFTGEDVCEFQVHGGTAIVSSILQALETLPNFRLARPGEYTKRAFFNKKMDLVEAEGLADLINAETELQRKQAFLQSQGVLSKVYKKWKDDIFNSLMNFESLFNFENIEEYESEKILNEIFIKIEVIRNDVVKHLNDGTRGETLRSGVQTVILGEPNVGKSSLYNFLCKRNAAIVTPYPGTTRDTLEMNLDILGYPVILFDTCGLRYEDVDPIEAEGVKIALSAIEKAQLLILIVDVEKFTIWKKLNNNEVLFDFIKEHVVDNLKVPHIINEMDLKEKKLENLFNKKCIILLNKVDKINDTIENEALCVSVKTQKGLNKFITKMGAHLKDICAEPTKENPAITKLRYRLLLEKSEKHFNSFLDTIKEARDSQKLNDLDYGLLGNDLRYSLRYITEIIEGRKDNSPVVDVLDEIFHNFCIGK
ncbi:tRNA modification GTPase GTPBP3, mitochondrial [Onthophagus taurus]|uniref:tRNA modification GTPase GTPBP3, mitochondrial n=1 Tax=Onthophagus taurus TaxID=166361 RepID=UPI000C205A03|nr:tRNA modification GTPase GTPBP3, mitochondrial [Onthophagus taurus]